MKKIIFIFLFSPAIVSRAQTIVTYDVNSGVFTNLPVSIKEGSTVSIKYTGLNPFLFTSTATFTDINHGYVDGLSDLQKGFAAVATSKNSSTAAQGAVAAGEKTVVSPLTLAGVHKTMTVQISESDQYYREKLASLSNIHNSLADIQSDIFKVNGILSLDGLIKSAAGNQRIYNQAKMKAALLPPLAGYGINSAADISTVSVSTLADILAKLGAVDTEINKLSALSVKLKDTDPEKKEVNDLIAVFRKTVDDVRSAYTGVNLSKLQNNFALLRQNADLMIDASFELPPVSIGTANGDFFDIKAELKDQTGKTLVSFDPHRITTYGGSRVDVSVGIGLNIGGNGSQFALRKNPDNVIAGAGIDKVILYRNGRNTLLQFDPAILIHWYKTTQKSIQWMITGGIGPDFSALTNTKLYFGTSLGFPSSNDLTKRLVINVGVACGFADVLKTEYRDWNDYGRFVNVENSTLTTKALRVGGFFAFSYNLGGTNHK